MSETKVYLDCAKCGAENSVSFGDVSDMTVSDPDTFRCFSCETVNQIPLGPGVPCEISPDQRYADVDGERA